MLSLHIIREQTELVKNGLKKKNFKQTDLVDDILAMDVEKRLLQQKLDQVLRTANESAAAVGKLMQSGAKDEAEEIKKKMTGLKEEEKNLKGRFETIEHELKDLLVQLPNLPHDLVPAGFGAEDNDVVFVEGDVPTLYDGAKPHWELCSQYQIIDFELGVKLTGAGFPVYKGKGAKMQRALINFFLDEAQAAGYTEIQPPILVNEDSAYATGQLPDKEGQMYHAATDNFYLIPTAEVPVTNIFRDVVIPSHELPKKCTAYTPCFRREAGSYGKDVRGLNRLHQFDKVEIVQIQHPDKSYETLEDMKNYVAGLLKKLGLPFRILRLCGGDMSFASAMTYDLEVFSAAQKKWLEVSSVSNFETFQANRLKLRYKVGNEKPALAHTLNGSALALPRILAAILENNQGPAGIKIPEVLVKYTGFSIID